MKKVDLIKMWQTRAYDDERKYSQDELNHLMNALVEAIGDAFEYKLDINEQVSLGSGVRLVVRHTKEKSYPSRKLKHIVTGEEIFVEGGVKPAKNRLVIEGFEKEL